MSSTILSTAETRDTKYCRAVREAMHELSHATNAQLLNRLRKDYPSLSATTIHRITARLHERGELAIAPSSKDGSIRYDHNTLPHDHFMCQSCGTIRDIDIADVVIPVVQSKLGKTLTGNITVTGSCTACSC